MKISGGSFRGRLLTAPKEIRPTSGRLRQAVFNICQAYIENADFLDVFAGSGAMGLEALSRGAKRIVFIEKSKTSLIALKKNIEALNVAPWTRVIVDDALHGLKRLSEQFDLIYVDPPYDTPVDPVLQGIDTMKALKDGGHLFLEERRGREGFKPFRHLQHMRSRDFGDSVLHEFTRKGGAGNSAPPDAD